MTLRLFCPTWGKTGWLESRSSYQRKQLPRYLLSLIPLPASPRIKTTLINYINIILFCSPYVVTNSQFSQRFILVWQFVVSISPFPLLRLSWLPSSKNSLFLDNSLEWTMCSPQSEWRNPLKGRGAPQVKVACITSYPYAQLPPFPGPSSGSVRENTTRQ